LKEFSKIEEKKDFDRSKIITNFQKLIDPIIIEMMDIEKEINI